MVVEIDLAAAAGPAAQQPGEAGRLAALARYDVLDSPAEASFDRITALVRATLGVPMAAVSLIDRDRQWFKSHPGIEAAETPRNIAFCDHTIRDGTPLVVADARADERFAANPLVVGPPNIGSYAGVPLTSRDGYRVGTLCALDHRARPFTTTEVDILTSLAGIIVDELELRQIARHDHLTGILGRRAFVAEAARAVARRDRYGRPCALLIFDIDHFKAVNDGAGHAAGDDVLRRVTQCCAAILRTSDVFGRIGGEEFAILLPELDGGSALTAANRFRTAIAASHTAPETRVTASFGVAPLSAAVRTTEAWLAAADAALFAAKRAGRDCCRLGPAEMIAAVPICTVRAMS